MLKSLPDDLKVVVDVREFGQVTVKSAESVDFYYGMTAHGYAYYEDEWFFMKDYEIAKEKVVYLSEHDYK